MIQRAIAVLTVFSFLLIEGRPVSAQTLPQPGQHATRSQMLASSCVDDASAPLSLYGQLPKPLQAGMLTSYVKILPDSQLAKSYVDESIGSLTGAVVANPIQGELTPENVQIALDQARSRGSLAYVAKTAPVLTTGQFICRGFSPAKYTLYAVLHTLAPTSSSGGAKVPVTVVFRGDVDASNVNPKKNKGLVPVTMQQVSQSPK